MPIERRISRSLSIFALIAVPLLFTLASLPSSLEVDRSALYAVVACLAVLALLHYAVRTNFSREGETLTGVPELLGGTAALAILSAFMVGFGGGTGSPFTALSFFCALLAGLSLDRRWSIPAWLFISSSCILAFALAGRPDWVPVPGYAAWFLAGGVLGMDLRGLLLEREATRNFLSSEVEKYLEREKTKSERISAVSHELRTPLTSMQGFAEILAGRDTGREKGEEFARIIKENAERMLRLASGLLDLSRAESMVKAKRERVNLARLAEEACETISLALEGSRIRLEKIGDPPLVLADPQLVRLALGNLITNAVKFSPPGEEVTVRIHSTERYACLSVEDRGPGIPREELPFIFHSFRRGPGAREADPGGTGLGLAVVKGVAEAHGGSVRVESEPGKGSTFTIMLPLAGEPAEPGSALLKEGRELETMRKGLLSSPVFPWILPGFTALHLGTLALAGRAGPYSPEKAIIVLLAILLALASGLRPLSKSLGAVGVMAEVAFFVSLALVVVCLKDGPTIAFPLFLAAGAFLARREEGNAWSLAAAVSTPAYLLPSLLSPPRDPMSLASRSSFLVLVPLFIHLMAREAQSLKEQAEQLRDSLREAMERDREASRLVEAAGEGMMKPLKRIRLLSEDLSSNFSRERASAEGGAILEEASELAEMVENLLDLMRLEAGRASLSVSKLGPKDMAALLEEATWREVECKVVGGEDEGRVAVDAERLSRVLGHALRDWLVQPHQEILLEWRDEGDEILLALLPKAAAESGRESPVHPIREVGVESLGLVLARRLLRLHGGNLKILKEGERHVLLLRLPRASSIP